jgi:hypothetical protein
MTVAKEEVQYIEIDLIYSPTEQSYKLASLTYGNAIIDNYHSSFLNFTYFHSAHGTESVN